MENRKELNLIVLNIVLLLLLLSICVGCSKTVESDLNLKCEGKHIHTWIENDVNKRTEEPWKVDLIFKEKRRYSTEDNRFLTDECQVWTDETIKCIYEKNEESKVEDKTIKSNFLSSYVINRITGSITEIVRLNEDEDYHTGTCTKIEGKKF